MILTMIAGSCIVAACTPDASQIFYAMCGVSGTECPSGTSPAPISAGSSSYFMLYGEGPNGKPVPVQVDAEGRLVISGILRCLPGLEYKSGLLRCIATDEKGRVIAAPRHKEVKR